MNDLVTAAQNGDKSAKIELWACVKKWVVCLCRKYLEMAKQGGNELDDLINTAYFGFDRAVYTIEPEKGYAFITVLTYCVRNELRQLAGLRGRQQLKTVSLDEIVDEESELTRLDLLEDESASKPFEGIEQADSLDWLLCKSNKLPERLQNILIWHYRDGISLIAIAQRLNISASRVGQLKTDALRMLRRAPDVVAYYEEYSYKPVGPEVFKSTWTSSVEWAVLRIEQDEQMAKRIERQSKYPHF